MFKHISTNPTHKIEQITKGNSFSHNW